MMRLKQRGVWRICAWLGGLMLTPAVFANVFTVTTTNPVGPGSLAQAITDANGAEGPDQIVFNIPGDGIHTIDLRNAPLPALSDSDTTIDGYTQPGAKPNTLEIGSNAVIKVQLDGGGDFAPNEPSALAGVMIFRDRCVVRGLSFTRFNKPQASDYSTAGIGVYSNFTETSSQNSIEGNFIGIAPDGVTVAGNDTGIAASSTASAYGGSTPAARNIIAGNHVGMAVEGRDNAILGNYIGLDPTGLRGGFGNVIGVVASGASIGGIRPGEIMSSRTTGLGCSRASSITPKET